MRLGTFTLPDTGPNPGINLNYRIWDESGGPALVLVHGLASTLRIWDFVAPLLARRFTVVAYDQRGHAGSDKPSEGYDLQTMLVDLRGLVEGLKLERPAIVGHSWGATLALAYAAEYPEDCAGIALIDGGLIDLRTSSGGTWEDISERMAPPDLSRYKFADMLHRAAGNSDLAGLPAPFVEEFYRSMMDEQPDGTIRARLARQNHMAILRNIYDARPTELLPRVKCPVLVVIAVSGEEESASEREAEFIRLKQHGAGLAESLLENRKIVWMHNTIHDIPLQRPERLAEEILAFFG